MYLLPTARGRASVFKVVSGLALVATSAACSVPSGHRAGRAAAGTVATDRRPAQQSERAPASSSTSTSSTSTTVVADLTVPTIVGFAHVVPPSGPIPPVVLSATGVPLSVIGQDGTGYIVTTPCQQQTVVAYATPIRSTDVVIDPGHGGDIEEGALGPHGLKEKDLNLAVASYLSQDLRNAGLLPILTRVGDYPMTVEARARIVRGLRPRAFISIHHNAEPEVSSAVPGTETYYQLGSPDSKRLSGLIWEEVTRALARYKGSWAARRDAGSKPRPGEHGDDYYGILRLTHGTPGSLAELAYITDPSEEAILARADVQRAEAAAIARAAVRFLTSGDPGSGYVEPAPRTEPAGGGGTRSPACLDPQLG